MFRRLRFLFTEILDQKLQPIHVKLSVIAMNEDQLKALLGQLPAAISQVKTDVEPLIAKATAQGVDLSSEGNSVTASLQALADIHTEATATPASNDGSTLGATN